MPNLFNGNPNAGGFGTRGATIQRNQLLRPFPQFDTVSMTESTRGKSRFHAGVIQINKRATGWWGGRISYTYSRLKDNRFGEGNYYSSAPGILNHYTAIPASEYFDSMPSTAGAWWTRRTSSSPARLCGCPSTKGRRWLSNGGWTRRAT